MATAIRVELDGRPSICVECGVGFEGRAQARTCSGACRVAYSTKAKHLPRFLTERARWIRYDSLKRPLSALTGKPVDITDASVTVDYQTAVSSVFGDGLGFVLNGEGLGAYDLDGCIRGGVITQAGLALVEGIHEEFRYVEVSPSGTGLHIWVNAPAAKGIRAKGFERYTTGRYLTMTGKRVSYPALIAGAEIG